MLFHKFANVSITDKYMISTLGGSGIDYFISVILDSSDNIIVAGYTDSQGAGGYDALLAKYDSSGTLLWQKILGGSGTDIFVSVILDSSDNIIAAGYTASQGAGSNDGLLVKLPPDGIEDGVYDVFTAATSTLTAATSTLTASNSTLTAATSTLTASNSTLIETFTTLTETFTTL